MSWAEDTARALRETLADAPGFTAVLGFVAIDGPDVVALTDDEAARDGLFAVGSITKTMTAGVLASLCVEGTVSLDAPVGTWLEAGPNAALTLEQLATHTSGLPRMAPNADDWPGFDPADPYAGYTAALAEAGLREATLDAGNGYSNFGYQLLGVCLERASGSSLAELLRARIFEPAGMPDAALRGTEPVPGELPGFDGDVPVRSWGLLLGGPGGVVASVADMAAYLRAVLDPRAALRDAIALALAPRAEDHGRATGLAWVIEPDGLVWHNGGTAGARAMCAADRERGRAAAVLATNGAYGEELDAAVLLALRDRDPREVRPEPLDGDGSWAARASEVAALIVAGDAAMLHPMLNERFRAQVPAEEFARLLAATLAEVGAHAGTGEVNLARRGGHPAFRVELTFARGALLVEGAFDPDGSLAGLRLSPA